MKSTWQADMTAMHSCVILTKGIVTTDMARHSALSRAYDP
eukprot:CAMPEP_0179426806 /NCGR_PEP_ID=MMETSP0799-20121207/12968_1 /TAXON_ID=46947 /ORGANISM="Geminigera cryophila, Strain CCMP2564" /LENGTH=39 /DNA_ID= /DNA_START= /DNA_END= /DNA_ORIENTATION=